MSWVVPIILQARPFVLSNGHLVYPIVGEVTIESLDSFN